MESTVNLPDEELIAQFKAGQLSRHEIIKILFERYYDLLYVIAGKNGLDQFSAEEVIIDTFISLPDKMAAYKGKSSFKSYLYLLFKHQLLEYSKDHHQIKSLEIATDPNSFDELVSPTDQTANRETYLAISNLLNSLPERQRTALILLFYEGASIKEIAEALNITTRAVQIRIHRARRNLRRMLEKMDLSFNDMV